jgi:hypothetical protein
VTTAESGYHRLRPLAESAMEIRGVLLFSIAVLIPSLGVGGDDRASKQQQLDAECETARERKLEPAREMYVQECVQQKTKSTLQDCQRFYADYGAKTGDRAPLYYDLPECVAAFEYRQSYRQQ